MVFQDRHEPRAPSQRRPRKSRPSAAIFPTPAGQLTNMNNAILQCAPSSQRGLARRIARGFTVTLTVVQLVAAAQAPPSGSGVTRPVERVSGGQAASNETITLSPFEVMEDARDTYDATNTNSITGTQLELIEDAAQREDFQPDAHGRTGRGRRGHHADELRRVGPPVCWVRVAMPSVEYRRATASTTRQ